MIEYILYIVIFQLLFLIAYDLFHKKDTFFSLNRVYLLGTSVLSFILPFIKIKSIQENIPEEYVVNLPAIVIGQQPEPIGASTTLEIAQTINESTTYIFDSINWWLLLYCTGAIIMLFRFIKKTITLKKLQKRTLSNKVKGYTILLLPNSKDAFSFYNTIYLGDQLNLLEKEQIIVHEIVHLREKHSLDLLWFEFLKIVFWFNPLIYVYQSRMNTLHEYIADAKSVDILGKRKYYEQLLNTVFDTEKIKFINQFFNHSLLKKRIVMLQKPNSGTLAKFKYLVFVPILGIMLIFSSFSDKSIDSTKKSLKERNSSVKVSDSLDQEDQKIVNQLLQIKKDIENGASFAQKAELYSHHGANTVLIAKDETFFLENIKKIAFSINKGEISTPFRTSEGWNILTVEKINDGVREVRYITILLPELKMVSLDSLDRLPKTNACKDVVGTYKIKRCVSNEIEEFVMANFNDKVLKTNSEYSGILSLDFQIKFKINSSGNIVDINTNIPIPEIQEEAKRVLQLVPAMIPGEKDGKKVSVTYSLPVHLKFEQETTKPQNTQQNEDQPITQSLSKHTENKVQPGHYLITGIFKRTEYLNESLNKLKKMGLDPKFFTNPEDGYFYTYLKRYDSLKEAKKMLLSDINGTYEGDLYILKIE